MYNWLAKCTSVCRFFFFFQRELKCWGRPVLNVGSNIHRLRAGWDKKGGSRKPATTVTCSAFWMPCEQLCLPYTIFFYVFCSTVCFSSWSAYYWLPTAVVFTKLFTEMTLGLSGSYLVQIGCCFCQFSRAHQPRLPTDPVWELEWVSWAELRSKEVYLLPEFTST